MRHGGWANGLAAGILFLGVTWGFAQPASALHPGPLKPGEGLALCLGEGPIQTWGEASAQAPMGDLAKLVWLRLEGSEWASDQVRFKCTGTLGPYTCSRVKGHGTVDLGQALRDGCDLAFLAWIHQSMGRWHQEYGDGVARAQMLEVFEPFLGDRLPPGDGLPALTPAWVGRGDLLRTSPRAMAEWLEDPIQSDVLSFAQRYLSGYFEELKVLFGREGWWVLPATAPVPGVPGATSAWVVAGREGVLVVLHLPRGRGDHEGLSRFHEILGQKP